MSERERWIVYPLLFFAFTLALRDQWPTTTEITEFDVMSCRRLTIRDDQGRPAVDIRAQADGANEGSGMIVVFGNSPEVGNAKLPAVRLFVDDQQASKAGPHGTVETYGPLGSRAAILTSDSSGGVIGTLDPAGRLVMRLPPRRQNPVSPDDPRSAAPRPPTPREATEADSDDDVQTQSDQDAAD